VIYHIAARAEWERAQRAGAYQGDTLASEGFIHCSEAHQVVGVANAIFQGREDLVLLEIEPARLRPELRYEPDPAGRMFPHVYGALNLDAVVAVHEFRPAGDGSFSRPAI
jgi:uncharacterized protein (DUF952 family)